MVEANADRKDENNGIRLIKRGAERFNDIFGVLAIALLKYLYPYKYRV